MEPSKQLPTGGDWVIEPDESNCYGLLISSLRFANTAEHYPKYNIIAVISVIKCYAAFQQVSIPQDKGISHKHIEIDDDDEEFIKPYFQGSAEFIRQHLPKGNVLVHCQAGISRSASIVISYLMERFSMSYDEARKYLKARRPQIDPNDGFVKQLKSYEEILKVKRDCLKKSMM